MEQKEKGRAAATNTAPMKKLIVDIIAETVHVCQTGLDQT